MRIKPTNIENVYKPCKIQKILEEFMDMDCSAVEVLLEDGEYTNMRSAQTGIAAAAKRIGVSVNTTIRQGHLYMFKTTGMPTVSTEEGGNK